MKTIYYCSNEAVKQILSAVSKERYDTIEVSNEISGNINGEISSGALTQPVLNVNGGVSGGISHGTRKVKELTKSDFASTIIELFRKNDILQSERIISESRIREDRYYSFEYACKLEEVVSKGSKSVIKVSFEANNLFFEGTTSIDNWISESYVNNLLIAGNKLLSGILQVISVNGNRIIVQCIVIGEKGLI